MAFPPAQRPLHPLRARSTRPLHFSWCICWSAPALLFSNLLLAQSGVASIGVRAADAPVAPPITPPIVAGQRLSEWLLQDRQQRSQGQRPEPYTLGTRWESPAELATQAAQKEALLKTLDALPQPKGEPSFASSRAELRAFIERMPVTGRVRLPSSDPRFLEVQPRLNPILSKTDRVQVTAVAPQSVTLIRSDGVLCKVRYQANVEARHYFRACRSPYVRTDWAWIIEPDGAVKKVSTAAWNEAPQDVPAPGAWIWSPPRGSGWANGASEQFSVQLAHFLATQSLSGEPGSLDQGATVRRPATLAPQEQYSLARDLPISANIWGETGLLQTPSARVAPAGTGSITMGWFQPYTNVNLFFSPLDWFEFGLRYTNINDIPYGAYAGGQSYKDKSTGAKVRFWKESAYLPEMAVGVRDLLGTGLFSGEYVVASKRHSNFDFTLGMGWGQLGTRNNVTNPFVTAFGQQFATRDAPVVNSGGAPNQEYFHGPAALFGGVQYHTPWKALVLKAEVDGNNYQQLPFGATLPVKTIFNFGATYQMKNADFTLGVLGNNKVMLTLSLHERMDLLSTPKLAEAKAIPAELKTVGNYTPTNPGLGLLLAPQTSNAESAAPSMNVPAAGAPMSASALQAIQATQAKQARAQYTQTMRDFEVQTQWQVADLRANQTTWVLDLSDASGLFLRSRINRGISALHRDAPPQIETFVLKLYNWGMLVSEYRVDRTQWMLSQTQLLPPSLQRPTIAVENASDAHPFFGFGFGKTPSADSKATNAQASGAQALGTQASGVQTTSTQTSGFGLQSQATAANVSSASTVSNASNAGNAGNAGDPPIIDVIARKPYETNIGISYAQVVGSPDTPLLFAFGIKADGLYKFRQNTWLSGTVNVRVLDNFGKYNYDPPPTGLQPVRTDIRQYMTQSIATMPNMQLTNTDKLGQNHFVSAYAGYLEMMFAGAGGEYLWRPTNSKVAFGVDINRVRQRQFNVWTSMQNYAVTTGHATAYWDTGVQDILVKFSYGKYLAGDIGGTLDLSRVFANGVKIGAYATRTNVDYAQFGEGSFDKGIYLSIPFDAFFAKHSDSTANLLFTPLIRDGGAMLMRKYKLYDMTKTRSDRALSFGPGD
jgi:hypothetical protein